MRKRDELNRMSMYDMLCKIQNSSCVVAAFTKSASIVWRLCGSHVTCEGCIQEFLNLDESKESDTYIEKLWNEFADVPMNPETERIEQPFFAFKAGTPREVIWKWFDRVYSKGVNALLYGGD